MSFFSKGRHKHANSGNEVFSFATQRTEESAEKKQENVSGALTPEEIAGVLPQETSGEGSALESLQKRMLDARQNGKKAAEILLEQNENIQEDPSDLPDAETARENAMSDAEAELPEPATGTEAVAATNSDEISEPSAAENEKTLLEKCRPFILDENGRDLTVNEEPAYHLQSVAELLKANSEETISRLSRDYGVIWEEIDPLKTEEKTEQETEQSTQTVPQEPNGQTIPVVSDFESNPVSQPTVSQQTATIKFTPVMDVYSSSRMSVSTQTKNIDLTGELADFADESVEEEPVTRLEETEFDEFSPPEEFTAPSDAKHFLRKFSLKKRSAFLRAVCSVWLAVLTAVFELPLFSDLLLSRTRPVMAVCTAFFAANVLVNVRMFGSIRYLFSRRATADIAAVLASVTTLVYAVYGTVSGEIVLELLVLMSVSLAVRALMAFYHDSTMLSNFKQIASGAPKKAVKLLDEPTVTYAMAKDSVEGDVLIAAPQRTEHVDGYMKYTGFVRFFGGRMSVMTVAFLLLSLVIGLAAGAYFGGAFYGLYAAAATQGIVCAPVLFFLDTLPLYSAAKKLNKKGAMIAGKTGAEQVADANAMVLHADDLFPSGTVTLHQMKVLSDNSIDDTLIRAAVLTDVIGSPLSAVFKRIAKTGGETVFPQADTVKYEDKMGVSGWVDDRLLFVGNRTLMETHGISVPSLEIDHKILRSGYFPVYVATAEAACALLAVQYTVVPEIAHELRRISNMGITMLIHSTDPNLTEAMVCDYMGLYPDSAMVMSNAGCHMYHNTLTHEKSVLAPAAYKGNPLGLAAIVNAANRIGRSNMLLTVLYVLIAVLGTVLFTYMSFDGHGSPVGGMMVLMYQLACTVISYILYWIERP